MMKPSWNLRKDIGDQTQGIVTSGFGRLEHGIALFLQTPKGSGSAWLRALLEVCPATRASQTGGPPLPFAVSLSFTASGLINLGLNATDMQSFSQPFREGMMQEDRLRRLGDRRKGEWLETVINGGPVWSGNVVDAAQAAGAPAYAPKMQAPAGMVEEVIKTPKTVHAMALLYATKVEEVEAKVAEVTKLLSGHGVAIVHQLPLVLDVVEGKGFSREHFGFADGISQPIPYDEKEGVTKGGSPVETADEVHGVRLGEILLGYLNGHQEVAPGPIVPDVGDGQNVLPDAPMAQGFKDLGINGSYVVVRQLDQDVTAFWKGMENAADALRMQDPGAKNITPDWVAEKVVGRGIDGRALRPDGKIPNEPNNKIRNDFRYWDDDRDGIGCPLGSHVRRANPRDSLSPNKNSKQTLLDAANNHRILRRARKYGPKQAERTVDDGAERGLLFICLNTDIARQFEFTQQTWLLNSDFSTLFEETDPLIGPDGNMTIPNKPLRRRAKVQTFVKLVGGEYFFLPSVPGLTYLASL